MAKEIPFHELHKKVKIRKLFNEDIEESNLTDSSTELEQSHTLQLYDSVTSHSSIIPDCLYHKKGSVLAHDPKLSQYSELPRQSEFPNYSDHFEYSENSEHSGHEYFNNDDYERHILHENIDPVNFPYHSPSPSNSSCSV